MPDRPALLLPLVLVSLAVAPAYAQDDFYRGKTISIVVGFTAGGGYDVNARAVARHMGKHIPGNPNVIVQNMPGAGSLTSVRYLDATAPKDGTVVTTFDPGLITESYASPEIYKIRFSDFQWIGALLRDLNIRIVWGWCTPTPPSMA